MYATAHIILHYNNKYSFMHREAYFTFILTNIYLLEHYLQYSNNCMSQTPLIFLNFLF